MPVRVIAGYNPSVSAPWHSVTPKAVGAEGPVMSASKTPTRYPCRAMATASMDVTVDLPTPPLPDTTAITFFTLDLGFKDASRLSDLRSAQSEPQLEQLPLQELICKNAPYLYCATIICRFAPCVNDICHLFRLCFFPLLHQLHQ